MDSRSRTALPQGVTRGRRKPLHETLPERLRKAREQRPVSARRLSLDAGFSASTCSNIESGQVPGIDVVERLARSLGLSPCLLAYGVDGATLPQEDALRTAGCGGRLRQIRERRGLSSRALGDASGTSDTTVRLTETGETIPSVATAEDIASALGCSPCWLAYAEGPSPLDDPDGAAAEFQAVRFRPPRSPRKA